jgi:hypothetical protein
VEDALKIITNPEVHMNKDNPLVTEMLSLLQAKISFGEDKRFGNYYGTMHFVLEHGQLFPDEIEPKNYRPGEKKQCFANSQELAMQTVGSNPELLYVEGFMHYAFPLAHGWNILPEGAVIDTTIGSDFKIEHRFGIVFDTGYIIELILERGAYTAQIDDWRNGWPLLKKEYMIMEAFHPEWNHF